MASNRRVVHEEHGAGEIRDHAFIGPVSVALVKFDYREDEIFVPEYELSPDILDKEREERIIDVRIDDKMKKELDIIRTEGLKEVKEIEDMGDVTLVDAFEHLIRNGAGPGVRRVVFMKREMLKRMRTDENR